MIHFGKGNGFVDEFIHDKHIQVVFFSDLGSLALFARKRVADERQF